MGSETGAEGSESALRWCALFIATIMPPQIISAPKNSAAMGHEGAGAEMSPASPPRALALGSSPYICVPTVGPSFTNSGLARVVFAVIHRTIVRGAVVTKSGSAGHSG